MGSTARFHGECVHGEWAGDGGIVIGRDFCWIELRPESGVWKREELKVRVLTEGLGEYRVTGTDMILREGEWCELSLPEGEVRLLLERV